MKTLSLICLAAALLLSTLPAVSQQVAGESPAGTKFWIYTPPSYSTGSQSHPLLISLHGVGEIGDDLSKLTATGSLAPSRLIYLNRWPASRPFIVLSPQLKATTADPDPEWPADYIDEVVRHVVANYRVDLNRVYITGLSRGGTGVWTYAAAYPNKIAAMVPISGVNDPATACTIKDIPIWAFHGKEDLVIQTFYPLDMEEAIKNCQPAAKFKSHTNLLEVREHAGWNEVYNETNGYPVFDWLLKFTKNSTANTVPYVNAGADRQFLVRSGPINLVGDFFDSDGTITNIAWTQTAGAPLSISNTNNKFLTINNTQAGTFEFELKVTDDDGAQSADRVVVTFVSSSTLPVVNDLVLVNGATNADIVNLSEGQIINTTDLNLNEINIKAVASSNTLSVRFSVNSDQNTATVSSVPYLIRPATTKPEWEIKPGEYLVCATPYTKGSATGTAGITQCFKFTVTNSVPNSTCTGVGKITREVWNGVTGTSVSNIPLNTAPSFTRETTIFETPINIDDNYGTRVRGYICPPVTGSYTFWISSNDQSELWLSTDADPAHKVKIAYVSTSTGVRQWTASATQQSAPKTLQAGVKYYIEALHKEGVGGNDNLAVGWRLPNGAYERPIPGARLIPFGATVSGPSVSITSPTEGQNFQEPASIVIAATASSSNGTISKVEFYNGATKLGEDTTSPYSYNWNSVSAGTYNLIAKAIDNGGLSSTASVNVNVTSVSQGCTAVGKIVREVWSGVAGTTVSSIPVNTAPSSTSDLTIFESPSNVGTDYGARIRGYICAPSTGNYVFWIASNDNSELWLSTDNNPANKVKIASVTGYTSVRQWTKYASQQSAAIPLVAGQQYYIEALHKQATGSDNLAVGWQLPNGTLERPIAGTRLSPFSNAPSGPTVSITSPSPGQNFPAPASVVINATASSSSGTITKVEFYNGVTKLGEDLTSPYSFSWNNVSEGNYTLGAKAIDNGGLSSTASVNISVTSGSQSCSASGTIVREVWTGVTGTAISSIPVNTAPASTSVLTAFEGPTNVGTDYGARIRGYICVPASGNYTFWIASNDNSELWLSTDNNPANKVKIASVTGYTSVRQWDKYPSQKSALISLTAGQQYYIEALHKQATGSDNLSVGWQLPNATFERPIPGNRLSPFGTSAAGSTQDDIELVTITNREVQDVTLVPNPIADDEFVVQLNRYQHSSNNTQALIEIASMTGSKIFAQNFDCLRCSELKVDMNRTLMPGVYLVYVEIDGEKFIKRLVVL